MLEHLALCFALCFTLCFALWFALDRESAFEFNRLF
tara:strand:- start:2687 stop:2794 length:108 start_codon:yes stop_codon:yes gene_type:complete